MSAAPARTGPPAPAARLAPVLRRCACGGRAPEGGECEECRARRMGLRRSATSAVAPGFAPPLVHDVLRSPGRPLDAGTRAWMEPRFGHSFADVRIHADGQAAASAEAVSARAYTVGRDLVFGAGRYAPGSAEGRGLIAHELAHVVQQSASADAAPMARLEIGRVDAPEERQADAAAERVMGGGAAVGVHAEGAARVRRVPLYPTPEERQQIQEVFNPGQARATAAGGTVPPVTNAAGFRTAMVQVLDDHITANLPDAQARQASPVNLAMTAVHSLADVAQREATAHYGSLIRAATHTREETQRRAGQQLRSQVHDVASIGADVDRVACNWVADRMENLGGGLLSSHNVLASSRRSKRGCPTTPTCPSPPAGAAATAGPAGERDQDLYDRTRDEVLCSRAADLRTLMLYQASFETPGEVHIQTHIAQELAETNAETERRGRWVTFGTLLHEMMHEVAHERFREAVATLERAGLATEGFAEYFALPVYNAVRTRAAGDDALRASIEGVQAPWNRDLAPDREVYPDRVAAVTRLRNDVLHGSEENLRSAFFLGQMEYLGLGGWTEEEARRRAPLRRPGTFGVVGLLFPGFSTFGTVPGAAPVAPPPTPAVSGGVRLEYAHAFAGVNGPFQMALGGQLQVLSSSGDAGTSVTIGPSFTARYSWPHLFVQGSVGVGIGGAMSDLERGFRLDAIPEFRAGVQLGIVRLSGGPMAVIPLASGPLSDRTVRLGVMAGISVDLGGP
jgi:hypothetical protein